MDELARGAADGVDGAVAQLPLTVKQELHHVEKVQGETVSVYAREAHRGPKKACLNKSSAGKAESDTGVSDKVGRSVRQSWAPSRGFQMVLADEDKRAAGLEKLSARPFKHAHPC